MNLPRNSAPLSFCNVRTSIASGFGRQLPPQIRPQGTSPGALQQVRVLFLFCFFPQSMYCHHLVLHEMKRMALNYRITPVVDLILCRYWKLVRQNANHISEWVLWPLRLGFMRAMIPANFDIPVRTPKWPRAANYSGELVASGRDFVGDWRWPLGLLTADLLFSPKPKQQVKPICNVICTFSVFRKYVTQYH